MNSPRGRDLSFLEPGENPFPLVRPAQPPVLMVDNESPTTLASGTHLDLRELVRLLQCPQCSIPFTTPVTLPCGHTLCRSCLPPPRPRSNISYPNTPDRLQGIKCPLPDCGVEHAAADCCVDVTLSKIMDLIRRRITEFAPLNQDTPTRLTETLAADDCTTMEEKEMGFRNEGPHMMVLDGGRLLATFTMAEMGKLRLKSGVEYSSTASASVYPDQHEYKYQHLDIALLASAQEPAQKELECLVCYNMMLDPTTTACGHTFCRRCLTRAMDHSNICPLCRRNLHMPTSLQSKPNNYHLSALLNLLWPDLIAERIASINLEEQPGEDTLDTPLFVCTLALPTMPVFLHVFEPRYRLMMRRCMEGNRRFGMIMYNRTGASQGGLGATLFMEYGTMLEIVSLELLADGRSFVETRGVGRFRIREHAMLDGYVVGRVEKVEDISLAEEQGLEQNETTLAQQLAATYYHDNPATPLPYALTLNQMSTQAMLDFCMQFVADMRRASAPWLNRKIVEVYGEPPADPALFPYWFACVLPISEDEKYHLLHVTKVRERLKIVRTWVERIQNQQQRSGGSCGIL